MTNKPAASLPPSLAANPKLSSWISFAPDGEVIVSPGKVEIGQGIVTALAQIAADELDVDIGRVRMVRASTSSDPVAVSPFAFAAGQRLAPKRRASSITCCARDFRLSWSEIRYGRYRRMRLTTWTTSRSSRENY